MTSPTESRTGRRRRSSLIAAGLLAAVALVGPSPVATADAPAPAWTDTVKVRDGAGNDPQPAVAVSDDGSVAVAVWINGTSSTGSVEAATATIDGSTVTWSDPVVLGTGNLNFEPSIALTPDGTSAIAVWPSSSGPQSARAAIVDGVATWGEMASVSLGGGAFTRVQISDDGLRAIAAWVGPSGVMSAVGTISAGVLSWGFTTVNYASSTATFRSLDLELSGDGLYVALAWARLPQFEPRYRAEVTSGTITAGIPFWNQPEPMSDPDTEDAPAIGVEMTDAGGSLTVVWGVKDAPDHKIAARTAAQAGPALTWGDTVTTTTTNSPGTVSLASSSDGSVLMVAWYDGFDASPDAYNMVGTVSGDTSTWGTPTSFSASGQANAAFPQVALASDGTSATAVYLQIEGSLFVAQGRSAAISGTTATWTAPTRLPSVGERSGRTPVVAMASSGVPAVAMWQQFSAANASYVAASVLAPVSEPPAAEKPSGAEIAHITRGDGSAVVVADDPTDDGGSAVTRHQARCTDGTTTRTSTASAKKRHVVTGLTNRVRWECSVRAGNSEGWSQWSPTKHIKPSTRPARDPQPPELKSVSPLSGGAIVRLDLPPKKGGSTIVGYEARCVRGDAVVRDDAAGQKRFELSGLTPGVTWKCSGRVRTGVGWSSWATPALEVVPGPVDF